MNFCVESDGESCFSVDEPDASSRTVASLCLIVSRLVLASLDTASVLRCSA